MLIFIVTHFYIFIVFIIRLMDTLIINFHITFILSTHLIKLQVILCTQILHFQWYDLKGQYVLTLNECKVIWKLIEDFSWLIYFLYVFSRHLSVTANRMWSVIFRAVIWLHISLKIVRGRGSVLINFWRVYIYCINPYSKFSFPSSTI